MPKAISQDVSLTKSYLPKVSKFPTTPSSIAHFYAQIEDRNCHEGRIVEQPYYEADFIEHMFTSVGLECLYQINESIIPRFILDFYSQVKVQTNEDGTILISFLIQHQFITLTLAQFGQILKIPFIGQAVFSNEWDLNSLEWCRPKFGPYFSQIPSPDDILQMLGLAPRSVTRKIKSKNVPIVQTQVLRKELRHDMKRWEELIRENAFGTGGHYDHLPACLAHMLYCIVSEQRYNLAYLFIKRIECARSTPKANLPYGMFLTRLYRHVMENYTDLDSSIYEERYPSLRPLALKLKRKPRSDKGKSHRASFHGSSSNMYDDDDEEENIRASTPSPTRFIDELEEFDHVEYRVPSPRSQTNEELFRRQNELLNHVQGTREEVRSGFKSFAKAMRGVFGKKKK